LDYRRSATGATNGLVQYQINSGAFSDITTINYTNTASTGGSITPICLSGIPALQNVASGTTVTFRIVNYGGTSSGGTWYIFDKAITTAADFSIDGTVSAAVVVTPPAQFTVTGGGSYTAGGAGVAIGLSGSEMGVNYQLYRNGGALTVGNPLPGTGNALTFGNLTVANAYTVVATKVSDGGSAQMLGSATVTVIAPPFSIYHVNDTHARLTPHWWVVPQHGVTNSEFELVGGAAHLAGKVLAECTANPNSLFLDGGDISEGNPIGDMNGNASMVGFYNILDSKLKAQTGRGIDAVVVGNHDVRDLSYITNLQNATFPVVSMNVCSNGTLKPFFKPYVIVNLNGLKVGVLGYTTSAAEVGASLAPILDVVKCDWNSSVTTNIHVADYVRELRITNQCDVVILLSHVGQSAICVPSSTTTPLLVDDGTVKLPEVVVSGHWHTWAETVWQPEILNFKTIFTESASYMKYLGQLTVASSGKYLSTTNHVIRNSAITPDSDVATFVNDLKTKYDAAAMVGSQPKLDDVIGYTAVPLLLDNAMKWWSSDEYPWSGDNTAGEWICDAMQWKAQSVFARNCDLALEAGGGVRADIPAGPVTYTQIYETFPWNDDLLTLVKMTGREIWNFIKANNGDAAVSQGWHITAQDGVPVSISHNGQPIDLSAVYNVAINNYMYQHPTSGFTYSDPSPQITTNLCRQAIVEYTAQFTSSNPMQVPGPRYELDTEFSGGYQAVVTMLNDADSSPSYQAAFIRLIGANAETLARRGSKQVPTNLVSANGSILQNNRLAEIELYRSFLGIRTNALKTGDIINVWGKGSAYRGEPEFVDQEGVYADGVEFSIAGHDDTLAQPAFVPNITTVLDYFHKNHFVQFLARKTGTSTVVDQQGSTLNAMDVTAYANKTLPGNIGDLLLLAGVPTSQNFAMRFRCASAVSAASAGYAGFPPVSQVDPIVPAVQSSPTLHLTAHAAIAQASSGFVSVTSLADATVQSGSVDKNSGTGTTIYLQSANSGYGDERGWIKFDLSSLKMPANATLTNVQLKLWCFKADALNDLPIEVRSSDANWTETGITWASQTALGPVLDTTSLLQDGANTWYSWDVTSYASSQLAGPNAASIVLKPVSEQSPITISYSLDAKEYQSGAYAPALEFRYSLPQAASLPASVQFQFRYSSDNVTWGGWSTFTTLTSAPYAADFGYPNGIGFYQFRSSATGTDGTGEPAHTQADASVQYYYQPVAGNYSMGTWRDRAGTLSTGKLLKSCNDPLNLRLSVTSAGPGSAQSGTVQLANGVITYTPAAGVVGTDTFTYTVTDTQGASALGTVSVTITAPTSSSPNVIGIETTPTNATVRMAGIPDFLYQVQASTDLINWVNAGWATAGSNGLFQFIDTDKPLYPQRFYRTVPGEIPAAKIAVFSDPHFMDPSLLINDGLAFQTYLAQDRKLLKESPAILDSVVTSVSNAHPNIVLVTGDLTKDGELASHLAVSNRLQNLKDGGAKVFVCPGNHDINNPHSLFYDGSATNPAPTIQSNDFATIYAPFGYRDAIARDPNSLSYVAEPTPGLWILSMDACHYEKNNGATAPYTGGYFDDARLTWITNQLAAARSQGKFVLGMVHHGVMEHYAGQKTLFPEYVLDNYKTIDQLFAGYGMKVVFTGHYHAQDVAEASLSQGTLFDIETGSTVTYPCPYRVLDLSNNGVLTVNSYKVTNIDYDLGGLDFQTHAYNYLTNGLQTLSIAMLTAPVPYGYGLDAGTAGFLAPAMVEAFASHYQGDENTRPISAYSQYVIGTLQSTPGTNPGYQTSMMMAGALMSLFQDPAPADNNVTINLTNGNTTP
jgi:2',3'-cyclic-nucleotide 2'-phosphodiesterase (5'-nucleotidase family)/3',5'-cyclic AMP phosphodiesterase CpdA